MEQRLTIRFGSHFALSSSISMFSSFDSPGQICQVVKRNELRADKNFSRAIQTKQNITNKKLMLKQEYLRCLPFPHVPISPSPAHILSFIALPKLIFKRQNDTTGDDSAECSSICISPSHSKFKDNKKHESPHKNPAINNLQLKLPQIAA